MDLTVLEIESTGIDVDYIAPYESLSLIKAGMTLDEIVDILGRPLGIPSNTINVMWRIGDEDGVILLSFTDIVSMIYKG